MTSYLKQIIEDSYANALKENNPEIARSIDKIVQNGGTMKQIDHLMKIAQKTSPEHKQPIFFDAIRAYARRAMKDQEMRREIKSDNDWLRE